MSVLASCALLAVSCATVAQVYKAVVLTCPVRVGFQHPVLYVPSQQGLLFNVRVFWVWAVNSILHSVLLFWLPMLMVSHDIVWPNGKDGGYLLMGNIIYTVTLLSKTLLSFNCLIKLQRG